jgi:hypothetical protein
MREFEYLSTEGMNSKWTFIQIIKQRKPAFRETPKNSGIIHGILFCKSKNKLSKKALSTTDAAAPMLISLPAVLRKWRHVFTIGEARDASDVGPEALFLVARIALAQNDRHEVTIVMDSISCQSDSLQGSGCGSRVG